MSPSPTECRPEQQWQRIQSTVVASNHHDSRNAVRIACTCLFRISKSQSAQNKSIRGLRLFELADLVVSSLPSLIVLLGSPVANCFPVGISRGACRRRNAQYRASVETQRASQMRFPIRAIPENLEHCWCVQKSTDICAGCSYPVPAVCER